MRSIIFTSVAMVAMTVLGTGAAPAQQGPDTGCFTRSYDAAHMSAHPDQVVSALRLKIYDHTQEGYTSRFAALDVQFANQGHVRRGGHGAQRLNQILVCFNDTDGTPICGVECDGGGFTVAGETDTTLTIRTDYLMVGDADGCGGMIDMAEQVGKPVKYRLNKADAVACDGM